MNKGIFGALALVGAGAAYVAKSASAGEETSFLSSMGAGGGGVGSPMPTSNPATSKKDVEGELGKITNNFHFGDENDYSDDAPVSKKEESKRSGGSDGGSSSTRTTKGGVKVYKDDFIGPIEREAVRESKVYKDDFIGPIERDAVRESTSKKEAAPTPKKTSWWKFW